LKIKNAVTIFYQIRGGNSSLYHTYVSHSELPDIFAFSNLLKNKYKKTTFGGAGQPNIDTKDLYLLYF